jgi:AraC-like DNA-binding protein
MIFFIPGIFVFMLTLLGWDIRATDKHSRRPKIWLFCCVFAWMLSIFLSSVLIFPDVYVCFNWLHYLTVMLYPVFFYRFIFDITRTSATGHFSRGHYVFPAVMAVLMLVLLLITPYDELSDAMNYRGKFPGLSGFYAIVAGSKPPVKFLYEVFCLVACFTRMQQYRRFTVNCSSDEGNPSPQWIYRYLYVLLIPVCISILMLTFSNDAFNKLPVISWLNLSVAFLQALFVCYALKGDYFTAEPEKNVTAQPASRHERPDILKKSLLTKPFFEEYISKHQPYLNPHLKITNLVTDLQLNRTYISGFINREYNMNFSRYINCCRLDEYNRLLADPDMKGKSNEELAELAGFASYRYFQRLRNGK